MAITKEEIKKLAALARIEIPEDESEKMTSEIDSILGYIGQINNAKVTDNKVLPKLRNVMREDVVEHEPKEYTEKILKNAPAREGNFLKVKKIL